LALAVLVDPVARQLERLVDGHFLALRKFHFDRVVGERDGSGDEQEGSGQAHRGSPEGGSVETSRAVSGGPDQGRRGKAPPRRAKKTGRPVRAATKGGDAGSSAGTESSKATAPGSFTATTWHSHPRT